jgi:hypothetical protein
VGRQARIVFLRVPHHVTQWAAPDPISHSLVKPGNADDTTWLTEWESGKGALAFGSHFEGIGFPPPGLDLVPFWGVSLPPLFTLSVKAGLGCFSLFLIYLGKADFPTP